MLLNNRPPSTRFANIIFLCYRLVDFHVSFCRKKPVLGLTFPYRTTDEGYTDNLLSVHRDVNSINFNGIVNLTDIFFILYNIVLPIVSNV